MSKCILRQTPGGWDPQYPSLRLFRLGLWVDDKEVANFAVNSGQPGAQTLRKYADSWPGSQEPTPEGVYPLGGVEWASGKRGDYSGTYGDGLGPVWISILSPRDLGKQNTGRGAFGHHLDANRAYAPGTDGCNGHRDLDSLKAFIAAFEKHKPTEQIVDYSLGTVPKAPGKEATVQATASSSKPPEIPRADMATVFVDGDPLGEVPLLEGRAVATVPMVAGLLGMTHAWDAANKAVLLKRQKS